MAKQYLGPGFTDGSGVEAFLALFGWGDPAKYALTDKTTVSTGTVTFNRNDTLYQRLQVGGALTIAFSNWAANNNYGDIILKIVNGGSAVITWPTINWAKGDGTYQTTPPVTLRTSGVNYITVWSDDGGTTLYGVIL